MKKFSSSVLAVAMLSLSTLPVSGWAVEQGYLNTQHEKQLRTNMYKLKIDSRTQDKLIAKLKKGEILDSMNPDKLEQVPAEALKPTLDEPIKRFVFPDGSVVESGIEIISKTELDKNGNVIASSLAITPDDSEVISSSCGSGYCNYNLRVYKNALTIFSEYQAAISLINGSADRISTVGEEDITIIGGYHTNSKLQINRGTESGSYPAAATLSFDIVWFNGYASSSEKLRLNVSKDTYSTSATY